MFARFPPRQIYSTRVSHWLVVFRTAFSDIMDFPRLLGLDNRFFGRVIYNRSQSVWRNGRPELSICHIRYKTERPVLAVCNCWTPQSRLFILLIIVPDRTAQLRRRRFPFTICDLNLQLVLFFGLNSEWMCWSQPLDSGCSYSYVKSVPSHTSRGYM